MRRGTTTPAQWTGVVAIALTAATGLAACGSTADTGQGEGAATGWTDDCAGEREGPVAVVGMDATTGDERWARTLGPMMNGTDAGGVLVVMSFEGEAIGIDPATGVALWCRPGSGPVDTAQHPAGTVSAVSGTTVVALDPSDTLVAFDARTGEDLWSSQAPPTIMSFPQIRGDRVLLVENVVSATYAGQPPDETNPVVATYDLATGARVDGAAEVRMREAVTQDQSSLVRQVTGPEPYQVTVIVSDPVTGAERWRLTRHGVGAWPVGDLVVFVDQLGQPDPTAAGTVTDRLIAYSAADGTELWSVQMDAASPFVLPGGEVVLWSSGSEAVAMDSATGEIRWRADHGSPGEGGDFSEPGRYSTFVPSADGQVLAGVIVAERPYRD
jgi:outer membrane protein assembly factor BamB